MTVRITTLKNGIRVVTDPYDSPLAAVGISVDAGTRHEPPLMNGLAHFLEHMAFKGTIRRTAQEITRDIEDRGGWINAHTGRDVTAYYCGVLQEDALHALDVLADITLNSTIPADELEVERGVILQEQRDLEDDLMGWLSDRLLETAYRGPLSMPGLGTQETVKLIRRDDLRRFIGEHYRADNIIVSAAGGIDHGEFVERVQSHFSVMQNYRKPARGAESTYVGGVYRKIVPDAETIGVMIAFPCVPLGHEDLPAAALFTKMVGGANSSPLFQKLREERGLCYDVGMGGWSWHEAGLSVVRLSCGIEEAEEAIPILCGVLKGVRDSGLTDDELRRGRRMCRAELIMERESVHTRMSAAQAWLAIHGKPYDLAQHIARYEAVDYLQIRRVIGRHWMQPPTIAIRGPEKACAIDIAGLLR